MCGHGLIGLAQAHRSTSASAMPGERLLAHLGLEVKAAAEIQAPSSRPIHTTEVVPLAAGEHGVPRTPSGEAA